MLVPDSAVAGGERVKLLDFGIAKLAEAGPNRTATSALMGTPKYMSPEQARGAGSVDEKSDVYSLGVMLFELLAGQPPFFGQSGELIAQHLYAPAPLLTSVLPTLTPAVTRLVERLLEKDKQQRPTMAAAYQELQEQLALFHDHDFPPLAAPPESTPLPLKLKPTPTALTPTTPPPMAPPKEPSTLGYSAGQRAQARKRAPLIGAGVAVVVLGLGAWGFVRGGKNAPEKTAGTPPAIAVAANQQAEAPALRPHWSIKTTPSSAQVLRAADEQELGQTPWSFDPPAGSGDQVFIVRLKGYQDQTLHFRGTVDSDQAVLLERKVEAKREGHGKTTPKSATKSSPTASPLFTPKSWMNR